MAGAAQLWLFFLVVLAVVVLPGLDMAFVLASSLVGGRRAGLWAVAGLVCGGICHVTVGALGLSLLLQVAPRAFNAMLLVGALYVAWIGFSLLRNAASLAAPSAPEAGGARTHWATFRRAALTNLLNPKAYLFMLAIFPQFIHPERGPIWAQAGVLGMIISATQAGVYGALALAAGSARGWLAARPAVAVAVGRAAGILLIATAVLTAVEGWRAL